MPTPSAINHARVIGVAEERRPGESMEEEEHERLRRYAGQDNSILSCMRVHTLNRLSDLHLSYTSSINAKILELMRPDRHCHIQIGGPRRLKPQDPFV